MEGAQRMESKEYYDINSARAMPLTSVVYQTATHQNKYQSRGFETKESVLLKDVHCQVKEPCACFDNFDSFDTFVSRCSTVLRYLS